MQPLIDDLLNYKALLFAALLLGFFLLERLRPEARQALVWSNFQRWARNYGLLLINTALSAGIVIPLTLFAADLAPNWRSGWNVPLAVEICLDVLLLDLFIYWWHRVNHEVPFLWRFHKVHHLDEQLDSSSAVRFHFVEVLLSACGRALLMVLLDVKFIAVVIFELIFALSVIYQHSNVDLGNKIDAWLSRLIITPKLHWTHHHQQLPYTNSNYGSIFSFWDRIFASRQELPTASRQQLPIGLDAESDKSFLRLLFNPFRK